MRGPSILCSMAEDYRFLVVEDDPDTLEFNELVLKTEFNAQVTPCLSHKEALAVLKEEKQPWSCIIADYRTREGNLDEIYALVKDQHPKTPLILIAVGPQSLHKKYQQRKIDTLMPKAYDAFQLIDAVKHSLGIEVASPPAEFLAVRFESLKALTTAPCDLYLKINDQKFSRVADQGLKISSLDPQKYQNKGAPSLYCRRDDWSLLLPAYLQGAYTNMQLEALKAQPVEHMKVSSSIQEMLQTTIRNFGWSEDVVKMAEQNIFVVKKLIESHPSLKAFEKFFVDPAYEHALLHSVLLSYILTSAYHNSKHIKSEAELDMLCLAAFIHDGFLEEHQIRNESQFASSVLLRVGGNKEDRLATEKHPQAICDVVKSWKEAPSGLASVLLEHHERPDGKGFPNKLKSIEISRLGHAFVIAHEVTECYLANRELKHTLEDLQQKGPIFLPTLYDFYDRAISMLEGHSKA